MEAEGFGPRSGSGAGMTMGRRMHASLRNRRRSTSVAFTAMRTTVGALTALGLMALLPAAASADTFTFTGAEQTYVVPAGVTAVQVEATGAAGAPGGSHRWQGRDGQRRGRRHRRLQPSIVEVGGVGQCNGAAPADPQAGAGGGAADVRTVSVADGGGSFCGTPFNQSAASLNSRLIVAGAGGGGGVFGFGPPTRRRRRSGGARRSHRRSGRHPRARAAPVALVPARSIAPGPPAPSAPAAWATDRSARPEAEAEASTAAAAARCFTPTLVSDGGGGGSSLVPPGGIGPVLTTDPASVEITPCTITGTPGNDRLGGTAGADRSAASAAQTRSTAATAATASSATRATTS